MKLDRKHIVSLAVQDATLWARDASPEEIAQCLQPGQLGADEGLIDALGLEETKEYFRVATQAQFERACGIYNAAWDRTVAAIADGSISTAAAALGRKGGASTSKAKADAARANGAKGGRPRLLSGSTRALTPPKSRKPRRSE